MFYAAAALPQTLWGRLRAVAEDVAATTRAADRLVGDDGDRPGATTAHFAPARCGCIGVPLPGVTSSSCRDGDKLEIRLTGPNVTPGYHRDPEATAAPSTTRASTGRATPRGSSIRATRRRA